MGEIFATAVKEGSTLTLIKPTDLSSRLSVSEYNQNVMLFTQFATDVVAKIETDRKSITSTPEYLHNYEIICRALRSQSNSELSREDKTALQYCYDLSLLVKPQHLRKSTNFDEEYRHHLEYYEDAFFSQTEYKKDQDLTEPVRRLCEIGFAFSAVMPSIIEDKNIDTISRVSGAAMTGAIVGDSLIGNFKGILSVAISQALIAMKLYPR